MARLRQATANKLTLVVWRLPHILAMHARAPYDCGLPSRWIKVPREEDVGADGVLMYKPLILTASDILPVTQMESRVLYSRHAIARAVHLTIPTDELYAYGHKMLSIWRQREQAADAKRNAGKLQNATSGRSKKLLDDVDPLEVTLCANPEQDDSTMEDVAEFSDQEETRPVWYHEEGRVTDSLMRHKDD